MKSAQSGTRTRPAQPEQSPHTAQDAPAKENQPADLLSLIEDAMPRLSKGQRQIALFIVNHYERAAYMTAIVISS